MAKLRERWRLLPYDIGSSADHFARSDALARVAAGPSVWWHSTNHATLILGAGQKPDAFAVEKGAEMVRRQSGGTAVYAGPGVLGLDVALPRYHRLVGEDVVESYRWLGEVWLAALQRLGFKAHLVTVGEARAAVRPDPAVLRACFGSLSPYEVTVQGRKLIGLAQVRRTAGVLLQSGLHLDFDTERLARLLAPDDGDLSRRLEAAGIGVREISPAADENVVMGAFLEALARTLGVELEPGGWTKEELLFASRA